MRWRPDFDQRLHIKLGTWVQQMPIPKAGLTFIADQDGAAVLDIERGTITTLNPTGAFVWRHLADGESMEAIIHGLAKETGEPIAIVEPDVQRFVELLESQDMLRK